MGEDLSTGMKIGVGIIVLLAILAIVMSIMAIVKNIANSATDDLTNSLHNMQNLKMDSYNQKVVTGNEVLGFLSLNQDTGMAVLISTAAEFKLKVGNSHEAAKMDVIHNYCALLDCFPDNTNPTLGCIYKGSIASAYEDGKFKSLTNLQLNRLFVLDDAQNCYIASPTMDDGDHKYNTVTDGIYSKTSKGYVNPDHKFHSYLVKDYSGTIIGVWFIEDAYTEYKKSLA